MLYSSYVDVALSCYVVDILLIYIYTPQRIFWFLVV